MFRIKKQVKFITLAKILKEQLSIIENKQLDKPRTAYAM